MMASVCLLRSMFPASTDCDRFSFSGFTSRVSLPFPMPQCCASRERLSSIGVNMLRDLAGAGFDSLFGSFSCGCGSCFGCGGEAIG